MAELDESSILISSVLKNEPRMEVLDKRLLAIGRQILNARSKGQLNEDYAGEFLRTYRDWKSAQSDTPFSETDFNAWIGKAVGWEQLLAKQGAGGSVSGRNPPTVVSSHPRAPVVPPHAAVVPPDAASAEPASSRVTGSKADLFSVLVGVLGGAMGYALLSRPKRRSYL